MISPKSTYALLFLFILFFSVGCLSEINPASERGQVSCREQAASLPPGTSAAERQSNYRRCLHTIDQVLTAEDEKAAFQINEQKRQAKLQNRAAQVALPSSQEKLSYCRLNQDNIIAAEKRRIRALGPKMMADQDLNLSTGEKEDRLKAYDDAERELEILIPPGMRGGLPLIPDAVRVYSNCDPESFRE